jgi:hypothetical protein
MDSKHHHKTLRRWLHGVSGVDIARELKLPRQAVQAWLRRNVSDMDRWRRLQHQLPGAGWAKDAAVAAAAGVSAAAVSYRRRQLGLKPGEGLAQLRVGHDAVELDRDTGDWLREQERPAEFVVQLLRAYRASAKVGE